MLAMVPIHRRTCQFGLLLVLLMASGQVPALRCSGDIVDEGDRRFQVEEACGSPDYVRSIGDPQFARYVPWDETWYFNFGSHRQIRVLHFRNGRLRRIDTAGTGFNEERADRRPCSPSDLRQARTAYELQIRCGEPAERALERIPLDTYAHDGHVLNHPIVEDWFYAAQGRYQARRVRIHDGTVIEVSTDLD